MIIKRRLRRKLYVVLSVVMVFFVLAIANAGAYPGSGVLKVIAGWLGLGN